MKVLVTGGTGFIGSYILRELAGTQHEVLALVRDKSRQKLAVTSENIRSVDGDIHDSGSLETALKGCDAVIHLVGIIVEHPSRGITFNRVHADGTRNVVQAARNGGVETFIHMSANGARKDGVSSYQTSKFAAEQHVQSAGFTTWTIFRPSLVFGRPDPGRPEFSSDLVRQLVKPFPILPVFGDGKYAMQPVAVESLAKGMVAALDGNHAGTLFEVGGPEPVPYVEILDRLAVAIGSKPKPKIHVPVALVSLGIAMMGWTGLVPITSDQLAMLVDGNTCDFERFHEAFGIEPIRFVPETLSYLKE